MYRYLIASTLALGALTATPAFAAQPVAAASAAASQLKAQDVVQHYSTLVYANYSDVLTATQRMQKAINAFLAKPSQATQDAARQAWLDAREFYGQTEAFRFYDGPIDNEDGPEGQINAWPMDESYVDYVEGDAKSGLINNRKEAITKERLAELNEHDGEENISTGWHAI